METPAPNERTFLMGTREQPVLLPRIESHVFRHLWVDDKGLIYRGQRLATWAGKGPLASRLAVEAAILYASANPDLLEQFHDLRIAND